MSLQQVEIQRLQMKRYGFCEMGSVDPDAELADLRAWEQQVRLYGCESDLSKTLRSLGEVIQANKVAKGWHVTTQDDWSDPNQIPADLSLIHREVSEALEAFRCDDQGQFREELSDVFIYLLGLAHSLEFDLGADVMKKVEKNAGRAYQHGGKKL